MFTALARKEVPLCHEIFFDAEKMSISFSLCPEANAYFLDMLPKSNIWARYFKSFSSFVYNENSWGFSGAFKKNDEIIFREEWITWECPFPKKVTGQTLNELSGNIKFVSDIMESFIYKQEIIGTSKEKQLMTIDGIAVESDDMFNQGAFGFSFSLPVLEFCKKIWNDEKIYKEIVGVMEKVWNYLSSQKKCKFTESYYFEIGISQNNPRLVFLRCPGNGAWIGTGNSLSEESKGMSFSSHNVDTKIQQLTLLAGAIRIANLARKNV